MKFLPGVFRPLAALATIGSAKQLRTVLLSSCLCVFAPGNSCVAEDLATVENSAAPSPSPKIVSLAPSNTELLYAIGAGDQIVGTCDYCDFPPVAKQKERVGTFISANIERLMRLKPTTVVLVTGQESLSGMLSHNHFNVKLLQNAKVSDIGENIVTLGTITQRQERARELSTLWTDSLKELAAIVSTAKSKPKVFFCVWPQPLITIGKSSFISDAVTVCGATNVASSTTAAYPQFSAERLLASDPDVIVLPHGTSEKIDLKRVPWSLLRAVKSSHVFYLPDAAHDGLLRPTLRTINGLYWLGSKLHPDLDAELVKWRDSSLHELDVSQ